VEGSDRLRLFCALLLSPETLDQLVSWQAGELSTSGGVRQVPRENLHVTLAFLGSTPAGALPGIVDVLRDAAQGIEPPVLAPVRYRETRSVGMIVFSDEEGRATSFAERLFGGLERLGVFERERREWLPHVTVARFREQPRLAPELPDLGSVLTSDAAVMISRLRPSGAQYEVLESVPLGG
jgi:2'-5' RNA ligase